MVQLELVLHGSVAIDEFTLVVVNTLPRSSNSKDFMQEITQQEISCIVKFQNRQ